MTLKVLKIVLSREEYIKDATGYYIDDILIDES